MLIVQNTCRAGFFHSRIESTAVTPRTLAIAIAALLFAAPVDAEERLERFLDLTLEELMNIEVKISTATDISVGRAPGVVTVLTREDIKATGATNLVDLLEGVPGVHVRANQFAFRPLVHFRGASANQTLLMINGNPTRDLTWNTGIFWKGIPASAIERIEVIRGPGSALFGADASAGVINVITRTAAGIDASEVGARVGSFDSRAGWVLHGTRWGRVAVGLTAEVSRTDGHGPFLEQDAQTLADRVDGTDASLAPGEARFGWENTDLRLSFASGHWQLLADYVEHDDLEIGITGAGVLDPVTRASDSKLNLDLLYDNPALRPQLGLTAALKYQHLKYSSGSGFQERPPGYLGAYPEGVINRMSASEQRWLFEAALLYTGFENHAIRMGAGHARRDMYRVEQFVNRGIGPDGTVLPIDSPLVDLSGTPYAFAPEKARTDDYVFVQDLWQLADDWELTLGARYDHYSDFGGTFNPRSGLVWQQSERLTMKLLYGEAFRAPNFQELYAETSFTLPNPALEPERSRTVELAASYAARSNLLLGANLFRFHQSDLIRPVPVAGLTKAQYRNTGGQTIVGVELEARWEVTDKLLVQGNFTARDPKDDAFRAFDQPKRDGYLRLDYALSPKWHWNVQNNWIGERERPAEDVREPLESYWLTDTTLRYAADGVEYAFSVRNLFDNDAREYTSASLPGDLPLPERNYFAEIRFSF